MANGMWVIRANVGFALALLLTIVLETAGAGGMGRSGTRAASGERPLAAGDLDSTFGTGGKQTTDFFSIQEATGPVAIQPDGKIVAAGWATHSNDPATQDFAMARYNLDGTLDQGFGNGGKQTTDFFGNYDQVDAIAIQSDGKIVLAGHAAHANNSQFSFALARYNQDGTLDQSFGSGGKQVTDFFGIQDVPYGLAIQLDGKLVAAGYTLRHNPNPSGPDLSYFALARYNPDGTLDQTFGSGGKLTTDFFSNGSAAIGVKIQADGKIVAAGFAVVNSGNTTQNFALARYNPDGSLDQSFGSSGKQTTDFPGHWDIANSVAIQADGKIVASGYARSNGGNDIGSSDFALARYNQDGSLDQGFGSAGKQTTDFFGRSDQAYAVAIQSDGKILLAGYAQDSDDIVSAATAGDRSMVMIEPVDTDARPNAILGFNTDFGLARYNQDGTLDQSFGSGGKQVTDFFGAGDLALGVALAPDGKIVLAGSASLASDRSSRFALARYNSGTLLPDFSIGFNPGSVTTQAGSKVSATLLVNRLGGFTGNVTVTPPQPSGGIKPKPPDPVTISGDTAVFKMKVGAGVSPGSYSRTFTATDDSGRNRTTTLTVVVP